MSASTSTSDALPAPAGPGGSPGASPGVSLGSTGAASATAGWKRSFAVQLALFAPLHLVLVALGYASYVAQASVAPIWPANGLTLALLLLWPRRRWAWVLAVNFLDEALVAVLRGALGQYTWAQVLRVAPDPSNEIEVLVGALLLLAALGDPFDLPNVRRRVGYAISAGVLAAGVGAAFGARMITDLYPGSRAYWDAWSVWWIGDTLGLLTIAPLAFAWSARERRGLLRYTKELRWEALLAFLGLIGACVTMYAVSPSTRFASFTFPYLLLPFGLWISLRFDGRATSIATAIVAVATLWGSREGRGPFPFPTGATAEQLQTTLLSLQAFLLTFGLTALLLTIAVASRRAEEATRLRAQEELAQAQKMEVVGRLAGGVAHDFNNYLTVIQGYASNLKPKVAEDARAARAVEQILQASRRAGLLTSQLLAFSRRQVVRPRPLELGLALRDLDTLLRPLLGEGVTLSLAIPREPVWTLIDPGHFEQVVMNLAINARDAMPQGGVLTLATREVRLDEERPSALSGLRPGRYALLEVADEGSGMSPDVLARLFEPFFTTKEEGRGTGLGLATVQGIVSRAGGAIAVDSALGVGSRFSVYLPWHESAPRREPAQDARAVRLSGKRVLVVDDDASVLELVRTILAEEGYEPVCAGTAGEALALARDVRVDLLVTDLLLPDLEGEELAQRLRAELPGLRVLFVSGSLRRPRPRPGSNSASERLLAKPFRREELVAEVRAALDGSELVAGR